mgnify:CR=1 FL=1
MTVLPGIWRELARVTVSPPSSRRCKPSVPSGLAVAGSPNSQSGCQVVSIALVEPAPSGGSSQNVGCATLHTSMYSLLPSV